MVLYAWSLFLTNHTKICTSYTCEFQFTNQSNCLWVHILPPLSLHQGAWLVTHTTNLIPIQFIFYRDGLDSWNLTSNVSTESGCYPYFIQYITIAHQLVWGLSIYQWEPPYQIMGQQGRFSTVCCCLNLKYKEIIINTKSVQL